LVSWTQKYAPQRRSEVVGNTMSVNSIIGFLNRFRNIKLREKLNNRALLLYGPPGIGKTSSILAIANALKFDVVIVNASDKRNKSSLRSVRNASLFSSLDETLSTDIIGQILLIDEVDGLSGTVDRGGIREIVDIIKATRVPIILTANDISDQKFKTLRTNCELSQFEPPTEKEVLEILQRIAIAESVEVTNKTLLKIIKNSKNDIRGSINSFQSLGSGRDSVTDEDLSILSYRDQSIDIRDFLRTLFVEGDAEKANSQSRLLSNVDYSKLLLILRDVTSRIIDPSDHKTMASAYELLARADISLTRASRKRIWSQLFYFYAFITKGLTSIIPNVDFLPPFQDWQLQVPQFWITLARQRKGKAIALKVGSKCLTSSITANSDIFPYLRVIYNNNAEMAADLSIDFGLFDTEAGKRQTKIVWNKEIDFFSNIPDINREIKAIVRKKYPLIERVRISEVDEKILLEAQILQKSLQNQSKEKKPKIQRPSKKSEPKNSKPTEKKEKKRKNKKKKLESNKTLADFF
jgi:replication factor C large subunit